MKTLNFNQMEKIEAQGGREFWDAACSFLGAGRVFGLIAFATPATAALALAADYSCAIWGVGRVSGAL